MSNLTRAVVRQGSVSISDRHMEVSMGMNMQSVGGGAVSEDKCNVADGMAGETSGLLSGGVWGMWVWSAGEGRGRQGWPVVAGNAGISAIGSEFNVASLDGFVDVNKYVGFEMNSSKTKDGVSVVSAAIDGAAFFQDSGRFSDKKKKKNVNDDDTSMGKEKVVSKRHRRKGHGQKPSLVKRDQTAGGSGPVCMRCEISSSLSPSRLIEEVSTTVSQNVWGNRRNSVSYVHGRGGSSKQIVTLCAFGMRGKRAQQRLDDEQQQQCGVGGLGLGAASSGDQQRAQNDNDDFLNARTMGKGDERHANRTYVPHVQMNIGPSPLVQGSSNWRVRDVMISQAIGNSCTVKCHSKGYGSNIGISSSLQVGNQSRSSIQHDVMWKAPGQDDRQHVLSKVSGKVTLVLPKNTMRKCQMVLSTKVCWSLGNIIDCTFSYTKPKSTKIHFSISKCPQKQPALQFGIQSGFI